MAHAALKKNENRPTLIALWANHEKANKEKNHSRDFIADPFKKKDARQNRQKDACVCLSVPQPCWCDCLPLVCVGRSIWMSKEKQPQPQQRETEAGSTHVFDEPDDTLEEFEQMG